MKIYIIEEWLPKVREMLTFAQRISDFDESLYYSKVKEMDLIRNAMIRAADGNLEQLAKDKVGLYPQLDSACFFLKGAKMGIRRCAFSRDYITLDVERDIAIANLSGAVRMFELILLK